MAQEKENREATVKRRSKQRRNHRNEKTGVETRNGGGVRRRFVKIFDKPRIRE